MTKLKTLSSLLLTNMVNRVIALVLAFFLWSLFSSLYVLDMTYTVPVHITASAQQHVDAPRNLMITLRGLRKHLRTLDSHTLSFSLNTTGLAVGTHTITPTTAQLGIPAGTLTIAEYRPLNYAVEVREKAAA